MKADDDYYKDLFERLFSGKLTPEEAEGFVNELSADGDGEVKEMLFKYLQESASEIADPDIVEKMKRKLPIILQRKEPVKRIFSGSTFLKYAAVFIVLVGASLLFFLTGRDKSELPAPLSQKPVIDDILPGGSGAVLTLSDGKTILLDSLSNGTVALQMGSQVALQDGKLIYTANGNNQGEVEYNTVQTPNGKQIDLSLADGTRVWLNAGSVLRFPTVFSGNVRKVEIEGEGYFEVAKNPAMPFNVEVDKKAEIEVLGTHFNVNSYKDEESIKTTLLEGSVRVSNLNNAKIVIKPGEQAQLKHGHLSIAKAVDLAKTMAWKNGQFDFNGASLREVMRQLERWYNIEVEYNTNVADPEFVGKMSRNLSLRTVLRGLEVSGVRFRLENRKLIIF